MSDSQQSRIAAFVSARICHDLINPLGAIGNGIELLGLTSAAGTEELELLQQSVQSAQARLQFLRIAFGSSTDDRAHVDAAHLSAMITRFTLGQRHQIIWKIEDETRRSDAQLICLMVLCAIDAMPLGGKISIAPLSNGYEIKAETQRTELNPVSWEAVQKRIPPQDITARTIQFQVLVNYLIETEKAAHVAESGDGFELRVTSL